MKIKTKLTFGLLFLFIVILCFGALGIFYVNRLSSDAGMILKDNHISLEYCNHMLKALEDLPGDTSRIAVFETNLRAEEHNITEPGEYEAAAEVRSLFEQLKRDTAGFTGYRQIRKAVFKIEDLNQVAIIHKNLVASNTATQAMLWLTVIVTILSLAAFTFVLNFPSIISKPIRALSEGIKEIANKNYSKRIYLEQKDEFGILADTFNAMAEKLDEYEHSSLAEIKFEKSRIEAIINKMNDGIIGLDSKQQILFFNAAAAALFGLQEKEVLGRYAPDIALQNDLLRNVLRNDSGNQLKILLNEKESFFAQESIVIQNDNLIGGKLIILRNVTPFKELDAAKTNFLATLSHELKTPLFAIKMSTQLLDDKRVGLLNTDQTEILGSIKGNSERLLKITGELLNISQIETGQITLQKAPTRPEVIALKAMQAVRLQASQENISFREQIEPGLPDIAADEEKTTWVLINFLSNAIKYAAKGKTILLQVKRAGRDVHFLVTDYGKGIEEKYVRHVFDRYFKVPGAGDRSGTGLGLAISKEFIEAQGGRIWVNSEYGIGSTFGFSIVTVTG
ncbi:HAMP domain-containing protein [Chitinophaga agrisoli]|uniref:histidine kinase n=1 Tax=Chitinophaga agrisoli TaxID=2607653 RepID=A0A5B2VQN6_9BACT|nr:HAMP domain-containing protein [Chitinophaga agrisoli]